MLKLLVFFSSLIIGFVLSFSLVFNPSAMTSWNETSQQFPNVSDMALNCTMTNRNETNQQFTNVRDAALKFSAMATGELDFNGLPFQFHPIMSRLMFVTFVLLINIVLLNLLIGWAVSDIHAIRKKVPSLMQYNCF